MAIIGFLGKPKSGKTLTAQTFIRNGGYDVIYSNIGLKGMDFIPLGNINDIKSIPQDDKSKCIFLDELNRMGADSWSYDALAGVMADFQAQHRKLGHGVDIVFCQQHLNMVTNRFRENVERLLTPLFVGRSNVIGVNDEFKPLFAMMGVYGFNSFDRPYIDKKFILKLAWHEGKKDVFACDLYDTYELVSHMQPAYIDFIKDMVRKYWNDGKFNLVSLSKEGSPKKNTAMISALNAKLVFEEQSSGSLASKICNYIYGLQTGILDISSLESSVSAGI
jgi:hypothetical protein